MAFVMDITGIGTGIELASNVLSKLKTFKNEIKQASIESELYQRLIFLEIEKNLQILNRIKIGSEFEDPKYLKDVLNCLDFTYIETVVHNIDVTRYLSRINNDTLNDEGSQEKSVEDHILYIIIRLHALRNYENLKRISQVNLDTVLIMRRIKDNLVQIKILLIEHKKKSLFKRILWNLKNLLY